MAWGFDNSAQYNPGSVSGSGTTDLSYAMGSVSNGLLVVSIMIPTTLDNISGATFNGSAMTEITTYTVGSNRMYLYYILAPSSGTHNITVTRTGSISSGWVVMASSYSGIDSLDTSAHTEADVDTGNFAGSISTANNNELLVVVFASDVRNQTGVASATGTEREELKTSNVLMSVNDENAASSGSQSPAVTVSGIASRTDPSTIFSYAFVEASSSLSISVNDQLTITDIVTDIYLNPLLLSVNDQLTITDIVTGIFPNPLFLSVSDQLNLQESITVTIMTGDISISVSDQLNVSESITVTQVYMLSVSDQITISESVPVAYCTVQTSGGTFANDATVGTVDWTDPGNAAASDDTYASAFVGSSAP